MVSLADGFPPEVALRVHPNWRENERAYWTVRDTLTGHYGGQWVAFAGGEVLFAVPDALAALRFARESGAHPFVVRVGAEGEACRMRRATFAYDTSYPGEPLPEVEASFRADGSASTILFAGIIQDTGADATALPWRDCEALGLSLEAGVPALIGGVVGSSAATLVFIAWVKLDGRECLCRLQADFAGGERIMGRDVLNRLDIHFRGPAGEVVINP